MEYVTDAQGKTVVVPSGIPAAIAATVFASPARSNAETPSAAVLASIGTASPAPTALKVTGLSTLEKLRDTYDAEVTRVEAEAAAVKMFATRVAASGKADIKAVESLPSISKYAVAAAVASAFGLGIAFDHFIRVIL